MALGPNRQVFQTRIRYAVASAAERGGILSASSTVGEALYDLDGSGALPLGILLDDVEDLNFDKHPEYLQRNVVDIGSVVGIANEGEFETDLYIASPAPTQGAPAYLHPSGFVGTVELDDGVGTTSPRVGTFLTPPNALGFVTLYVEL